MTELLNNIETPSDAELISRVRGGDVAAYGDLFSRHVSAANRLARQLMRGPDADDLVAEAFAKVLSVLQGGGGPDVAFRAYLLTAVRRLHVDRVRAGSRLQTTDDMTAFDPGIPFQDTAVEGFENGAAAKAFASLPERWQLVLWHLEVEGQKPADIAPLLGMSANSVSALAYRAREGLRQAFLTMHLSDISDTECRWVNEHLGAYVRHGLSKRDTTKVQTHLEGCRRCTAMYLELTEVNSNLSAIIAPLLLGAAATGYAASTGGFSAAGVVSTIAGRVRDVVVGNATVATAGAVAASVAAAAVVGITLTTGRAKEHTATADKPVASTAPSAPKSLPAAPKKSAPTAATTPATRPVTSAPPAFAAVPSGAPAPVAPATDAPVGYVPVPLPGDLAAPPSQSDSPSGNGNAGGPPASKPGTTDPGTNSGPGNPGNGQPGTTDPGPSNPGPGKPDTGPGPTSPGSGSGSDPSGPGPGPSNPGPGSGNTDPGPGSSNPGTNPSTPGTDTGNGDAPSDPGTGQEPSNPDSGNGNGNGNGGTTKIETTLTFSATPSVVDGQLQVAFSSTVAPDHVTIGLVGDTAGIQGLGQDDAHLCTPSGLTAECPVAPTGLGAGGSRLPALETTPAFSVSLPLDFSPNGDPYRARDLQLTITLPSEYETAEGKQEVTSPVTYVRSFDFALVSLESHAVGNNEFALSAQAAVPPTDALKSLSYRLTAPRGATITPPTDCVETPTLAEATGADFTCSGTAMASPVFFVTLPSGSQRTVTVELLVPEGWADNGTSDGDRARAVQLSEPLTVEVRGTPSLESSNGAQRYWHVPLKVAGLAPATAMSLHLDSANPAVHFTSVVVTGQDPGQCTLLGPKPNNDAGNDGAKEIDCTGLTGDTLNLDVVVFVPAGRDAKSATFTASTDNQTSQPSDVDFIVQGQPQPTDHGNGVMAPSQGLLSTLRDLLFS